MTGTDASALAEIHQRLAACTQAGDARKAENYAACFTRDGILELDNQTIAGREAILSWMTAPSVIPQPAGGTPGFISHHLTTCHVDFTGPDSATARTYWLVTSAAGLDHNGFYVDKLRRENGAWLIAHRRPRTLWISPASVLHGRG
ncbi:nuclear transport factor 2 family protein [Novosphingobium album (ex Hu et al. 2023)]|uniref:Nuclear transport factor 2 family protein n=1 Tax=Novosphingobium album (ex Hu et al. 2023) TaxID=2930093 RepID=A0ABT0B373_9SPHN|nr:nuclear transport factor 2 family protein [Novosphingobium album (ex Hu et al. 2023)]MCJ2179264.1 nuclear transport factor 2 family protein [Novosphingobium album (ex Hu et al. 2023)]